MKHVFYDVKIKKKVETEVTDKVAYPGKAGIRYALVGKSDDGRNLTAFVKKDLWDSADV